MTKQIINIGQSANDKAGDPLRTAFSKVNDNFAELYNHVSAGVVSGAIAPADPGVGDLWWDTVSGRLYVYYGATWVDASPVDGAGINSTNELVNGNKTVSLDPNGLTTFPTFQTGTESLYLQGTEFGSVNSGVAIAAKNQIILAANILDTARQWTFGTEGKLTLPAGTTYAYLDAPLTGHGDGLARLDFTLVTDGVETQWAAATASPAGSGYSIGDTFTFDEVFLGIPGASVTIEVLTVGLGGSVENLAFTQPPLYPADIYRDSPINLQVGPESNRWTFGANGKLTFPNGLTINNSVIGYATSNTISEEIPGGTISSTSIVGNQIAIDSTNSITISKVTTQINNDGVTTTTDSTGSRLEINNTGASIKRYIDPDGPNNAIYFQVRTDTSGAVLEGVEENIGYTTYGRVTASQGVVEVSTGTDSSNNVWQFGTDGKLTLPAGGTVSYIPTTSSDWNGIAPTTIEEAIDRLAAVVKALNNGTGA